jgi:2-polyprenyl-3-methyl-5-hydroxy-6-metoxy-1,4-benzoquinol methylase
MSIDRAREEARIRAVYAERDRSGKRALSAAERPENQFWRSRREQIARALLADAGYSDLSSIEVLDAGCGAGDWLRTLRAWGAAEGKLHGIDLLEDRIGEARAAAPAIDFRVGSGWALPF